MMQLPCRDIASPASGRDKSSRLGCWIVCLALALGAWSCHADAPAPTEYEVKAAFLFNFAQFVEWPSQSFAATNAPLTIGIVGDDPFGDLLDGLIKDERVAAHPLVVKRFGAGAAPGACQILFVSRSEKDRLPALLGSMKERPILTVGESEQFNERGGMIRFLMEDGKVRFEINPRAAERAGLRLNSNLLRVARIVQER
ncbi:MAG TPA: YfiR family protein [Verrucomicrobiae bacterium]|jgi:hypothetical protein|nr:YfiR family protein [Verrucomicrobiae bacterium]